MILLKKIILISAKAGHGKDTFASMLRHHLETQNQSVYIVHLAKHIKQILIDYYGWDGLVKNSYWRTQLQYLGTERIRHQLNRPLFHVNRIMEEIVITSDDFDYYIVPDCRFKNEVNYAKAYFPQQVIDVRITRPNYTSALTPEQQQHPSETDLDDFNFSYNIENNTLTQLEESAIILLRRILI